MWRVENDGLIVDRGLLFKSSPGLAGPALSCAAAFDGVTVLILSNHTSFQLSRVQIVHVIHKGSSSYFHQAYVSLDVLYLHRYLVLRRQSINTGSDVGSQARLSLSRLATLVDACRNVDIEIHISFSRGRAVHFILTRVSNYGLNAPFICRG